MDLSNSQSLLYYRHKIISTSTQQTDIISSNKQVAARIPAYPHHRSASTRSARRWSTRSRCRCRRSRCSAPVAGPRAARRSAGGCSPPPGCGRRSGPLNHPARWSWRGSGSRGTRSCRRPRCSSGTEAGATTATALGGRRVAWRRWVFGGC